MTEDYQFDDLDSIEEPSSSAGVTSDGASDNSVSADTSAHSSSGFSGGGNSGGGSKSYASELFSKQIKAKFRTFYIDLKESSNGKFVKISEKSHGRKSTIMMDAEDVPIFMEALKEVSDQL